MKVMALNIIILLDTNSGGLHALDMIALCTNMPQYYVQADGIPQFIVMMEDTQKKAKHAGMPIANVELVMMALAAVLAAQHFPRKVDDWEGLPTTARTSSSWKVAFCLAHLKRQCQLQALGGGKPLGSSHFVTLVPTSTIDRISTALNNLVLVASNITTVLQQLTAANLVLMASVAFLMTVNKKLAEALGKKGVAMPAKATGTGGPCSTDMPFPGNYCWTDELWVSQHHTNAICNNKATGHKDEATSANMMGGNNTNKGWFAHT
jgi:hypothetical protein